MIDPISNDLLLQQMQEIQQSARTDASLSTGAPERADEQFGDVFGRLINDVDQAQKEADLSIRQLATGESNNLQDVVMKLEQAEISFNLMKEIRNKLLEAYKEVMTMQS